MARDPAPGIEGPEPTEATGSLSRAGVSGIRWVAVSRLPIEVGGLATAVVLAHLVTPTDFGRAAVVNGVSMLAMILSFEGFGTPLVQRARLEPERIRTALTLSAIFGIALSVIVFLFGALAAQRLFDARTASLIELISPAFVVAAVSAPSMALLQRRLDFRRLMVCEVVPIMFQYAGSIGLAAAGLGARAIVAGFLINYILTTLMLWRFAPLPRLGFDRNAAREIVGFGATASLAGLAMAGRRNVAYIVLGALASPALTGLFWRAYQVGGEYQGKFSVVTLRVLFPLLTRTRDIAHMRRLRLRAVRANSALTFPMLGVFVLVAPEVFPFVFGERWRAAVEPAQLLTVVGATFALVAGSEGVALAVGKPRNVLSYSLIFLVLYGVASAITAPLGLVPVCVGAVVVHVIMLIVSQWLLVKRTVGLPVVSVLTDVLPALTSTIALGVLGGAVAFSLRSIAAPGLVVVVAATAAGLIAYATTLRMGFAEVWGELAQLVAQVTGGRAVGDRVRLHAASLLGRTG